MGAFSKAATVVLLATTLASMSAAAAAAGGGPEALEAVIEAPNPVSVPLGMAAAAAAAADVADATPEAAAAAATAALPPPAKRVRRMLSDEELEGLEATLQYNFTNKWLLREALIHPNFGEWNNAR